MKDPHADKLGLMRDVIDVLEALDYANINNFIHRDIKPENLLVDAEGRVRVADFGLVRPIRNDDRPDAAKTMTGFIVGTPAYMSPEQYMGNDVDKRTDIFSVGVILYQIATGKLPYADLPPSVAAFALMDPRQRVPSVTSQVPEFPPALDRCIAKMLEKDPGKRYQSCAEAAKALESALATL
jgi:serine/threonine-protein kinase